MPAPAVYHPFIQVSILASTHPSGRRAGAEFIVQGHALEPSRPSRKSPGTRNSLQESLIACLSLQEATLRAPGSLSLSFSLTGEASWPPPSSQPCSLPAMGSWNGRVWGYASLDAAPTHLGNHSSASRYPPIPTPVRPSGPAPATRHPFVHVSILVTCVLYPHIHPSNTDAATRQHVSISAVICPSMPVSMHH